ncbi:hypothetical protein GCM10027098_32370 [Bowmanella dokdonensis]
MLKEVGQALAIVGILKVSHGNGDGRSRLSAVWVIGKQQSETIVQYQAPVTASIICTDDHLLLYPFGCLTRIK